jgi:hypothetical protein
VARDLEYQYIWLYLTPGIGGDTLKVGAYDGDFASVAS